MKQISWYLVGRLFFYGLVTCLRKFPSIGLDFSMDVKTVAEDEPAFYSDDIRFGVQVDNRMVV